MRQEYRVCNQCGWVHVPLSRAQVEQQAREFGEYITAQPPKVQGMFALGPESKTKREWNFAEHVAQSERCFHCGNPHTNFHGTTEPMVREGVTMQGIISE